MGNLTYFLLTFLACMIGGVSGLGGGIIIKPVMDAVGAYNISTINALSSITILTMTTVSIIKGRRNAQGVSLRMVTTISLGGILGGIVGNYLFQNFVILVNDNNLATIIQAFLLIFLLGTVIIEEVNRDKINKRSHDETIYLFFLGSFAGIIGAFLGIGGGLINKPLLVLLIGLSTKSAAYGSLCIIFFSQLANVITLGVKTGFADVEPSLLPYMMLGAVVGGMAGSKLASSLNTKYFDKFFLYTLVGVLLLNVMNVMRNIIM